MSPLIIVLFLLLPSFFASVCASPVRRSITALRANELSSFVPYIQFARAAYCPSKIVTGWKCGQACKAIQGFIPTLTGGNGNSVQFHFVGYWPAQRTVVVAHQGTDPRKLMSALTDLNILRRPLDPKLFPGVPASVRVHDGFRREQARTAPAILAEVKKLLSSKHANSVTIVGHSLGGALAQLDALYLRLQLGSGVQIKAMTFGTPRVGNGEYVRFFDSKVYDFHRINNQMDLVPNVPGRKLGFLHPHGEIHLLVPGRAVACSGDDNAMDSQCQVKTVPNIFKGSIMNHLGPYMGIAIGNTACT